MATSGRPTGFDAACRRECSVQANPKAPIVIILGIILLIIAMLADISILYTIGIILIVIGAILWILGAMGNAVGGRKHYF